MRPDVITAVSLEPAALRAAHTLFGTTIHRGPAADDRWAQLAASYSPGRTLGIHEDAALVATATSFPVATTVPGGAAVPTAAVTRVGVRADRTRRGLLTALMRTQLADVAARGEVLASLRASEARIYGRFGYGVATRGRALRVDRRGGAGWRRDAPRGGAVRLLDRDAAVPALAELYRSLPPHRPGAITRPDPWWTVDLGRAVSGSEHLLVAVHRGPDGDDGFAVASAAGSDSVSTLRVDDLHAAGSAAVAGLWRFLLGVDLADVVSGRLRPLDEPLELLLADPRDCTTTDQRDETWLRLVDVEAALVARSWGPGEPVLLAVHDALLPANAATYKISREGVERVAAGPADLTCAVADLAVAYLGDRRPSALVAAGRWTAHRPDAPTRADTLFATDTVPWSGTFF